MKAKDENKQIENEETHVLKTNVNEEGEDDSAEPSDDGSGQDDTSDDEPSDDQDDTEDTEDTEDEIDEDPDGDSGSDDGSGDSGGADSAAPNPFDQLVLERFRVFGITAAKGGSWSDMAETAMSDGWRSVNLRAFQESLARNVDGCYRRIAAFRFRNADDDLEYDVWFDNERQVWDFSIKDSPDAELLVDERGNLFKCEPFRKYAEWAYLQIDRAFGIFNAAVERKFEAGDFLMVDEVKMQALSYMWTQESFVQALRGRKYLSPDFEA